MQQITQIYKVAAINAVTTGHLLCPVSRNMCSSLKTIFPYSFPSGQFPINFKRCDILGGRGARFSHANLSFVVVVVVARWISFGEKKMIINITTYIHILSGANLPSMNTRLALRRIYLQRISCYPLWLMSIGFVWCLLDALRDRQIEFNILCVEDQVEKERTNKTGK